jgi:hypothetical protein
VREDKFELGNKHDYCSYDFHTSVSFEKKSVRILIVLFCYHFISVWAFGNNNININNIM